MTVDTGTILVVDDDWISRSLLSKNLKDKGHAVETAENGRQALDMLRARPFDLILLDLLMPEMDGFTLLGHIKADHSLRHIPVIVISAVDEMPSVVRCIEMGAADHLPKPFNPVLLRARIESSLEKKRLHDLQEAYTAQLDLENKRKSEELERARKIQRAMLPATPPDWPYLDIAAYQKTASEVGGDYYDFFPQADGKLVIALGDATGHGVSASLMVAMTKASLLATEEANLSLLLQKINAILCKIDLGRQLNMALLLLEIPAPRDGQFTLKASGGGSAPVYVLHPGGAVDEVVLSGLPLGIACETRYDLATWPVKRGDALILMSDGLSETFNADGQMLGYDRMLAAIRQIDVEHLTAGEILRKVEAIGDDWAGACPLRDDVTLVVIRTQ